MRIPCYHRICNSMPENLNRQQTYTLTVVKSFRMKHRSQLCKSALWKRDSSDSQCPKRISGYLGSTLWLWPTQRSRFCLPTLWTETEVEEMQISQLQLQVRQHSYQMRNRTDACAFTFTIHILVMFWISKYNKKKGHNRKIIQEMKTFECRCLKSHTWTLLRQ